MLSKIDSKTLFRTWISSGSHPLSFTLLKYMQCQILGWDGLTKNNIK